MTAHKAGNPIWKLGRFDTRKVKQLVEASERAERLRAVEQGEAGDIRVHASATETAWLMQAIVGLRRLDAALGEDHGHWYVDIRNGDGVMAEVVELVKAGIGEEHVSFATVCFGKRTLSFYPAPPGGVRPLAA